MDVLTELRVYQRVVFVTHIIKYKERRVVRVSTVAVQRTESTESLSYKFLDKKYRMPGNIKVLSDITFSIFPTK